MKGFILLVALLTGCQHRSLTVDVQIQTITPIVSSAHIVAKWEK